MKRCSKCKILKNETEFCKHKQNKDGLDTQCRECKSKHYFEHRDQIYKQRALFHELHPEKRIEHAKKYRDKNIEKEKFRHQVYYQENKPEINKRNKKWRDDHPNKERERHAKKRNLGLVSLNKWFEGSEFHHFIVYKNGIQDNNAGMYIPKELHRSIPHKRKTLLNFDKINTSAMNWIITNCAQQASAVKSIVEVTI